MIDLSALTIQDFTSIITAIIIGITAIFAWFEIRKNSEANKTRLLHEIANQLDTMSGDYIDFLDKCATRIGEKKIFFDKHDNFQFKSGVAIRNWRCSALFNRLAIFVFKGKVDNNLAKELFSGQITAFFDDPDEIKDQPNISKLMKKWDIEFENKSKKNVSK